MPAEPRLPFRSVESEFMSRSLSIYRNMVARFAQKENKRGRIIRVGRAVEFTLEDFREWLREKLGGEGGVTKCAYCSAWISMADCVVDHMTPVSRGGGMGLDNLTLCDKPCNGIKGSLTAEEYIEFRQWALTKLHPEACKDLFHRLAISVQLAAQQRWQIVQRAKAKTKAVEVDDGDF